ncbi:MAG: ATP-dependent helicase [Candidatus Lokiarchaeota archaeon]|nr:ATP-dependent helicase [Candidatus Lokiarchaeota archaeon]
MSLSNYEEIVENYSSPTLVLAGPGAGKTYLLSDRVIRLMQKGVDISNITVVTFGKDASLNMKDELTDPKGHWKLNGRNIPKISTLHSLAFEIVNENPRTVGLRKDSLTVQPDEFIKSLMFRDACHIMDYEKEVGRNAINCKAKGDCNPSDEFNECDVCKKYWEIMAKCDRIDFDDQILFACTILEKNADILNKYQELANHLLVDEYQDINAAQHRMIELLSRRNRNGLFVVGDDAQSIYGFRGASPEFILNFQNDFHGSRLPQLPHSRRCHELILRNAEKVLIKFYKSWTGPFELNFHVEKDEAPIVFQLPSEVTEAIKIARITKEYRVLGLSVLILSPKKELFLEISKVLSNYGIPHSCPISLLSKNTQNRLDSISIILEWVKNKKDNFLTRQVIETLINGGIAKIPGAKSVKSLTAETKERRIKVEKEIAGLWGSVNRKVNLFQVLLENTDLSKELNKVKNILLDLIDKYDSPKTREPAEFLKQVALSCGAWITPKSFSDDITRITQLLTESDSGSDDSVRLMTMRKAKGLEADVVIIAGLEDDLIPNPNSDLSEEARLFYVSMTRAKKKLFLLHAYRRPRNISYGPNIENKKRSIFLDSLGIKSQYVKIQL